MSAQPVVDEIREHRPRLSVVHAPAATVSTIGFIGIILVLIAIGLGGVMIVTTSVGAQSRDLAGLRKEATELGYQAASLESQLQRVSSASALAMRATELGMVPNPYPAFINLGDGSVTGVPKPVTGKEMPFLRGQKPEPEATVAPVATPKATPNPLPPDLSATGTTDEEQP